MRSNLGPPDAFPYREPTAGALAQRTVGMKGDQATVIEEGLSRLEIAGCGILDHKVRDPSGRPRAARAASIRGTSSGVAMRHTPLDAAPIAIVT